jgi:hypothetical protein
MRRRTISNPDGSNPTQEYLAVGAIAVPDQVTWDLLPATRLRQLIGDPFGRRLRSDPKPQDRPSRQGLCKSNQGDKDTKWHKVREIAVA